MEAEKKKSGIVIVNANDYLPKAREEKEVIEGKKNGWDRAVELAFDANGGADKYVTTLSKKGEMRLIFKA